VEGGYIITLGVDRIFAELYTLLKLGVMKETQDKAYWTLDQLAFPQNSSFGDEIL